MNNYLLIAYSDIAKALAKRLSSQGKNVIIASRHSLDLKNYPYYQIDIENENTFKQLFANVATSSLTVINTMGVLHDDQHQPEKSIKTIDISWFLESMKVNCLSSLMSIKHLSQNMTRKSQVHYIAFSARVSSITDNSLGGWASYRCSKSALNMAIKTAAIEWMLKYPQSCLLAYHPGTVDTRLSKPFQNHVKKSFTTDEAAGHLLDLLDKISPEMSGRLYDWKHELIEF